MSEGRFDYLEKIISLEIRNKITKDFESIDKFKIWGVIKLEDYLIVTILNKIYNATNFKEFSFTEKELLELVLQMEKTFIELTLISNNDTEVDTMIKVSELYINKINKIKIEK